MDLHTLEYVKVISFFKYYHQSFLPGMKYFLCLSFLTTIKCLQAGDSHSNLEMFPSYVHLEIEKQEVLSYCGGVYIHSFWILTAAHCLVYNEAGPPDLGYQGRIKATMGTINYNLLETGQKRKSRKLVIHEEFVKKYSDKLNFAQTRQKYYDLGLVKIKSPFDINRFVDIGFLADRMLTFNDYLISVGGAYSVVTFKSCKTLKGNAHINCDNRTGSPLCDGAPVFYNQTWEMVGVMSITPKGSTFLTNSITYRKWIESSVGEKLISIEEARKLSREATRSCFGATLVLSRSVLVYISLFYVSVVLKLFNNYWGFKKCI